jgi:hypothetical protein
MVANRHDDYRELLDGWSASGAHDLFQSWRSRDPTRCCAWTGGISRSLYCSRTDTGYSPQVTLASL